MVTLEFVPYPGIHYHVPLRIYYNNRFYDVLALYDTGATCCTIPKSINDAVMRLQVVGKDSDIETAKGSATFDVVIVDKIEILEYFPLRHARFRGKKISRRNVRTWICPENDTFTAGANLFQNLDVHKFKDERLRISD